METLEEKITVQQVSRGRHIFLITCSLLCLFFLVWIWFFKLDIVSVASGRVVPYSRVKSIQHLEGGIIREISVREGDHVKPGQPLVILEGTASNANVEELQVRINALRVDIARMEAETQQKEAIGFTEEMIKNHPDLVKQAQELFEARQTRYLSEVARQKEKIKQRQQDIREIKTRLSNNQKSLSLLEEQIAISDDLLKDSLSTRYNHLNLLREATRIKSKIEEDTVSLKRGESSLAEAREKLSGIRHSFLENSKKNLKESRQKLEEYAARFRIFTDHQKRTVIRSPVEGVVKTLYVFTKGGVVKPGMTLMEVVPATDRLVIEAHLPIRDIGYVQIGQKAIVKLASRDAGRFGRIMGTVLNISPDAFTTADGGAFYTVRIETEKTYFEQDSLKYHLYPGVMVMAFIHTGQRTLFEYLMDPFLNTLGHSLQER